MVRAVLFDLFGTLVEYQPDRARLSYPATHSLLRDLGYEGGHDDFVGLWDGASLDLEERTAQSHVEFSMYDASSAFCDAADLALSRPEVDQVASTFVQEWCRHVVAVPGAADLVRALSEQLRVGIVSNTHDAAMVAGLLMDLGLSDVVHAVVLSVDHGYRKPHPSIYQVALDALSVTAQETVFVGDSLSADYLAPRELGIAAYLIDPHRAHQIAEPHRLDSVLDLASRLQISPPSSHMP